MGEIFTTIFINPIINVLVVLYQLLIAIHVPYALGFSIIALTVVIRIVLYPLMASQIKATAKMQKITPHLARLKEQHKGDAKRLQAETMKLYQEHGVNPAASCLPVLIQFPILWSLYSVLIKTVGITSLKDIAQINNVLYSPALRVNHVWDTSFFGVSLSANPSHLMSVMPLLILVPVLTGVLQFFYSKMMMPEVAPVTQKKDDFQTAFQTQSMYILPIMIGFFSFTLPIGLSLYWNTFSIFGILQQYFLVGPGGLKPWLLKIKK